MVCSLSRKDGACWASNSYLADELQHNAATIARDLGILESCGLIERSFDENGRRRIIPHDHMVIGVDDMVIGGCSYGHTTHDHMVKHIINREDNRESARTPSESKSFKPPTVGEVQTYCTERGNGIDAQHFVDYYEARGWKLGKDTMKNWKAAVRTWERRGQADGQAPARPTTPKLQMIIKPDGTKEAVYLDD